MTGASSWVSERVNKVGLTLLDLSFLLFVLDKGLQVALVGGTELLEFLGADVDAFVIHRRDCVRVR